MGKPDPLSPNFKSTKDTLTASERDFLKIIRISKPVSVELLDKIKTLTDNANVDINEPLKDDSDILPSEDHYSEVMKLNDK